MSSQSLPFTAGRSVASFEFPKLGIQNAELLTSSSAGVFGYPKELEHAMCVLQTRTEVEQ